MGSQVWALSEATVDHRHDTCSTRPHILTILPRGEAIRNFIYSGALEQVSREAAVTILSVIPNEELDSLLRQQFQRVIELREVKEKWLVRMQRELLDLAHGRWLWSKAAQERWRLRDREATTPLRQMKRWSKKLACYPFANRLGLEFLSHMDDCLSRWCRTTDEYLKLCQQSRPSLVFNTSHVHSTIAVPIVQAARWLGIPTAAFIFSWDNLTSQGRIIPSYDYYLVWNESLRQQLLEIYPTVRPEQVIVTGTPQFDFYLKPENAWTREEFCRRVGADPRRPIVLYSTGMANHMPGEPEIVERIAQLVNEMSDLGPPQLLVRVYPKDRTGRFEDLKRRRPEILFPDIPWEPSWLTPRIEDIPLLTNTLKYAAVGINVASTISLELCMFDKPVVNVAYNAPGIDKSLVDFRRYYDFDHYRPLIASGAVALAESEHALASLVREALVHPERRRAQRRALIEAMFGETLNRPASSQIAATLLQLATTPDPKLKPVRTSSSSGALRLTRQGK